MKKNSKNSINRIFSPFIKAIRAFDSALISLRKDNDGVYTSREEKITVFAISYVLAMILWMVVNLNGSYSINVDVPLAVARQHRSQVRQVWQLWPFRFTRHYQSPPGFL